jgi:cobyrinic acid a,c-diamide synthase
MTTRVVVVAGVASGVGKTSVTLGLLEALRRRGVRVQAFKVGPDFIDPGLHALATGRASYNLDGWMYGRDAVRACVARQAAHADLAVVEGVMGCFDGIDGTSEEGSTAQIAKWLHAPVVLVVDAWASARSAAAVVHGFESFDPALSLAGVIVNRVGGDVHGRMVLDAIAATCRAVPLGAIPRDDALTLPERHLGLVTAAEGVLDGARLHLLADAVERSVDLDRLLSLAREVEPFEESGRGRPESECRTEGCGPASPRLARIGVARDAAFQFYYAENLDLLREAGAELHFWSPLGDHELPDADGLYLGGGYPELHARRLAGNAAMRKAVRRFAEAGRPVYAECGGLMYLAETLEDADGVAHPMAGVLPVTVRMRPRRMALGYTEVAFTRDTPIGPAGAVARGHEFHYSTLDPVPDGIERVYRVAQRDAPARAEGYLVGRTLMSYVHLGFASNPELPRAFVAACAGSRA